MAQNSDRAKRSKKGLLTKETERVAFAQLARNSALELILTFMLLFGVTSIVRWVIGPSLISHLTFAQKQGGSKLGKLVPKWHTAWDWKALRREVCHHDNAVGSIDDETLHIVCSVSGLGIRLAPIGFLRPVA